MKHRIAGGALAAAVLSCISVSALAQSAGEWTVGIGAHMVNPASDNGTLAGGALKPGVGNDTRPTATVEYFVRDNLGIELVVATPFEHHIKIDGLGTVGETRHLPPTVSLQYHFNATGGVSPFIGAGVNYTVFFEEKTSGPLAGTKLELDSSLGAAVHAGIDFKIGRSGALRLDARWIDIDTDAKLDGADIGTVEIDPLVYGAAYVVVF